MDETIQDICREAVGMDYEKKLQLYKELVAKCPRFELKGKTMPYTSANGHMFSQLNKNGEFGIRFEKSMQEKYMRSLKTTNYRSYGAVMQGYVQMPEDMWNDLDILADYLNESYDYVMSLETK
jgi:hypothetical protein